MNETLKRALSGAVYVAIMWFGTANEWSYPMLFGVITILCVYEILKLRKGKSKIFAFIYVLTPLFLIQLFGISSSEYTGKAFNPSLILFMFTLTWTFDTFAYLIGKPLGKHKIMPSISPKKSWEGFVGGLAFTLLVTFLVKDLFQFDYLDFNPYIFAAFLPFTATLGDFLESHFKRQAGVKDSGNFIPGHGGMLDRMDAFMITIPALYIYIKIFCT
tara:strand:- start:1273 stop:1920 length:648 start_codon:yes stop_codon:yes gene_type:complete